MPARFDWVVWKKMARGQAGTRWDREIEKVRKKTEGNQDEIMSNVNRGDVRQIQEAY